MVRCWLFILFFFFFGSTGFAAKDSCLATDLKATKPLSDLQNHSCEQLKKSTQCQQAYKQIKDSGENPDSYSLQCKDRGQVLRALENYTDIQAGCAKGGWNMVKGTFVDLGTAIGEGVAKIVVDRQTEKEENARCDKDIKIKKSLYTNYNSKVPLMLQVKTPTNDHLGRRSCVQLKKDLQDAQANQSLAAKDKVRLRLVNPKATYTAEEKEYINWLKKSAMQKDNDLGVIEAAKKRLHDMGIQYECYNMYRATAMICETMFDIASYAAGGVGVGVKVGRIAGVVSKATKAEQAAAAANSSKNVDEFIGKVKTAERRGVGGAGQQLTNQAQKDEILNLAGAMTKQERVAAFESIAGRKLTSAEAKQLQKMHEVGTSQGRTYASLTDADLKAKAKLASEINPATGKAYFTKQETDILMRNGITGTSEAQKLKDYQKYAELAAKNNNSQYYRLHAESSRALGKSQEAEGAYKKAYATYVKEKKVDFSNATTARQKLSTMTERDLYELENLAAFSGNTEKLAEVTKAKWSVIEKGIRSQYKSGPGASQMLENTVRDALEDLQKAVRSNDPMIKKAANEKIKAMKTAFPGL